jgi:Xaa-Pro aminopeptidase
VTDTTTAPDAVPAPDITPETAGEAGTVNHDPELTDSLRAALAGGWAADPEPSPQPLEVAAYTAKRREQLSAAFPGRMLVVSAGEPKVRANDTDYPFRACSDYVWLTGHTEPDGVLVLSPDGDGHQATLFVRGRSDRTSTAFFTDRRYGEFWVGPRPGVREVAARLGIGTEPREQLTASLQGWLATGAAPLVLRGFDSDVDATLVVTDAPEEQRLAATLSELRLVKDDWEVAELEHAVAATARGFADAVRELPQALAHGERWVEGTFWRRARVEGNDVGYGSIVAGGQHATTLHWVHNDGPVRDGELLLLDMGVEVRSLYTADVTRTLPVSGRFSPVQRRVYQAVWDAQQAGIAACRPGARFLDPHRAAMRVLAARLAEWGVLDGDVEASLSEDPKAAGAGLHRRWTLHGVSHMLGLDVHDCAQARDACYRDAALVPGMVLTVEPGLYFQRDDLTVPAELRGIGVRIEDDVLITAQAATVLSAGLPSHPDAVEEWMASLR